MHEGCAARERGGGRGWSDEPGPVTNAIRREGFVNVLKGEPGSSGPASLCCSQGRRQPARQHTPPRGSRLARRSSAVPPPSSAHSSRSTQAHLPRCLCCQLGAEARVLTAAQADTRPPPAPHVRLCRHDLTVQHHGATPGANQQASTVTVLMTPTATYP